MGSATPPSVQDARYVSIVYAIPWCAPRVAANYFILLIIPTHLPRTPGARREITCAEGNHDGMDLVAGDVWVWRATHTCRRTFPEAIWAIYRCSRPAAPISSPPTSVLNGATADEDVRGDAHAYCLHVCALTEGSPTYILHAVITCRLPAYGVGLYLLAPSRVFWCGRIRWLGRATRGVSVVGVLGGTRVAIGEEGA